MRRQLHPVAALHLLRTAKIPCPGPDSQLGAVTLGLALLREPRSPEHGGVEHQDPSRIPPFSHAGGFAVPHRSGPCLPHRCRGKAGQPHGTTDSGAAALRASGRSRPLSRAAGSCDPFAIQEEAGRVGGGGVRDRRSGRQDVPQVWLCSGGTSGRTVWDTGVTFPHPASPPSPFHLGKGQEPRKGGRLDRQTDESAARDQRLWAVMNCT